VEWIIRHVEIIFWLPPPPHSTLFHFVFWELTKGFLHLHWYTTAVTVCQKTPPQVVSHVV